MLSWLARRLPSCAITLSWDTCIAIATCKCQGLESKGYLSDKALVYTHKWVAVASAVNTHLLLEAVKVTSCLLCLLFVLTGSSRGSFHLLL